MRDGDCHGGAAIGGQLRAAVEAKPADPEHPCPDHHHAGVVRRGVAVAAGAEEHGEDQGGKARGFMDDDASREIANAGLAEDAAIGQHPAAPDPVGHGRVDEEHPEGREEKDKAKADPLDIGADDQRRRDDREGHLEGEEEDFGEGAGEAFAIDAT